MVDTAEYILPIGDLSDDGILGTRNPYEVLGVDADDSPARIRNAYVNLAICFHPDRHPPSQRIAAGKVMRRINWAWEILKDPEKRAELNEVLERTGSAETMGRAEKPTIDPLSVILAEILRYEQIFSDEGLQRLNKEARASISQALMGEIKERVVTVIGLDDVPKWWRLQPGSSASEILAVVTNLRMFVAFKLKWQSGNTEYTQYNLRAIVFPTVAQIRISTTRRFRWQGKLQFFYSDSELTSLTGQPLAVADFSAQGTDLKKLFLVASIWGIPIEVTRSRERVSDYLKAMWQYVAMAGLIGCAVAIGLMALGGLISLLFDDLMDSLQGVVGVIGWLTVQAFLAFSSGAWFSKAIGRRLDDWIDTVGT